jgi:hypothetical protein
MKVIDKSDREILLDLMKLPSNIKDYDIDEQYYFIHEIINILEKSVFMDDYSLEHSNYTLSSTQDSAYQNALRNFQTRDYLNVYFEIVKFIENDGNKENRKIYEVEMNNIKSILIGIKEKIKESTDLLKAFHKLVDKLNINSDFIFWIGDGNISPIHRDKYKGFTLRDNKISVDWLGKEKIFQDDNIVTQIKEVIVKNKEKIYDFYERQKSESGEFPGEQLLIGTYSDECNGSIDSLNFSVCNRFQNEELNEFYKKFKNELFDIIEKYIYDYSVIRKTCIDKSGHKYGETTIRGKLETDNNLKLSELLDLDNNTEQEKYNNTNIPYKDDINEKYNGISGIISIKNILIK